MLEIGKIVNTHGLKGEMKIAPWCDGFDFFKQVKTVFINEKQYEITNSRQQKNLFVIKLSGVDSVDDTPGFINKVVYAKKSTLPELPENTYYIVDLIGLEVFNNGECVGKVYDVLQLKSNDVYVVKSDDGKEILVPAIKEFVKNISIDGNRIDVCLTEEYVDED
ncbi:MAG: 16S rRNA processing protein RimM [Clostridia bacterium]|nr:16S rRNA processing protein RimM [Clostridia bacterium]